MKDLQSQLGALFGARPQEPAAPAAAPATAPIDPLLETTAHHDAPWWKRALAVQVETAPRRNADAKLHAAIQQTDGLIKALKRAGRNTEARALSEERADWLGKREKAAWAVVKARLQDLGVSEKLYRSLKQGEADPVTVLTRLDDHDMDELRGASVKRLKAMLGG